MCELFLVCHEFCTRHTQDPLDATNQIAGKKWEVGQRVRHGRGGGGGKAPGGRASKFGKKNRFP